MQLLDRIVNEDVLQLAGRDVTRTNRAAAASVCICRRQYGQWIVRISTIVTFAVFDPFERFASERERGVDDRCAERPAGQRFEQRLDGLDSALSASCCARIFSSSRLRAATSSDCCVCGPESENRAISAAVAIFDMVEMVKGKRELVNRK